MFLKVSTVNWKISGPERNVIKNGIVIDRGAFELNSIALDQLKQAGLVGIHQFIDPLDLYKNFL